MRFRTKRPNRSSIKIWVGVYVFKVDFAGNYEIIILEKNQNTFMKVSKFSVIVI